MIVTDDQDVLKNLTVSFNACITAAKNVLGELF